MPVHVNLNELIEYTDWEREKWRGWLAKNGDRALLAAVGPNGDGRLAVVGDIVRHVFSAEKRYIERLSGRELTDTSAIPNDQMEALFQLGQRSRKELKDFVASFPAEGWDVPADYNILKYSLTATPRKIVTHVLMHEIRHWAQIATLLRWNGFTGEFHDFLFSPAMGGTFELQQEGATAR